MIYKFNSGGVVKLHDNVMKGQQGIEKVPIKKEPPKSLISVKETKPQAPQPLQPYESVVEKLKKKFAEMKKETKRPNTFGKFLITRDGTIVVEDGGKIA